MSRKPLSPAILFGGRKFSDPQISPDGWFISTISRSAGGRNELSVFDLRGGHEVQLPLDPPIASARGGGHCWMPDSESLTYIAVDGRIYLFDLENSTTRMITSDESDCSALTVSSDGTKIAFVVDLQHVYVADLNGDAKVISDGADFVIDPQFSTEGKWVAWHEWDVPNMAWDSSRIVVRDIDGARPKHVVAGGTGIAVQQPRFSPDGKRLSYLSDENGWLNLWAVNTLAFDSPQHLVNESYEHGDLTWGPSASSYCWVDGENVALTRNEGGFGSLVIRNIDTKSVVEENHGFFEYLHCGDGALCAIATDVTRAQELVVFRTGTTVETVARGPYAGIDDDAVVPQKVSWNSADGFEVNGRLYNGGESKPMIVWIHGGPHGQSPATYFQRWQFFLDRGWSILVPDYRGSNGWGREYLQALMGRWGEVDVADVVTGINAAIENKWCDAGKVVVYGGSAGGLTVLSVLASHPDLCAAGVAIYPVTDMEAAARETWRFEAHYFDSLVGSLPDFADTYKERSPLTMAGAIKAPVLLLHGDADVAVPSSQSTEMAKAIEAGGGTVEITIYEGEGHGWRKPETSIDELERVDRFLQRYVIEELKEDGGA